MSDFETNFFGTAEAEDAAAEDAAGIGGELPAMTEAEGASPADSGASINEAMDEVSAAAAADAVFATDEVDELALAHFAGKIVRKDLTALMKRGANVPTFVLEYLLGMYCSTDDPVAVEAGLDRDRKSVV